MINEAIVEAIKKTKIYAHMVVNFGEDMAQKMLQRSIENNTTPACCYRCAEHDTCELGEISPWNMICCSFTLEKPGSEDTSKKPIIYDEGYYEAIRLVKAHVTQMRDYYKQGAMCSLSESIQGEATCDDILKYLEELAKR